MSTPAEMAERHGAVLAELAELGLTLARGLHDKALAAETPEAACELGLAFHRISRSVRQSLALEVRLAREHAARDRAPPPAAPEVERRPPDAQPPNAPDAAPPRKRSARPELRLVWTEAERPEAERPETEDLREEAPDWVPRHARAGGAGSDAAPAGPVEVAVARLRAALDRDKAAVMSAPPPPAANALADRAAPAAGAARA